MRSSPVPLVRLFVLEQLFVPVELGQPSNADALGSPSVRRRLGQLAVDSRRGVVGGRGTVDRGYVAGVDAVDFEELAS